MNNIGFEFIWNAVLTLVVGPLVWALSYVNKKVDHKDEVINNIWKSIAETREHVAGSYVTRAELHNDLNRILQRFDRLEEKLDRITGGKQ